MVAKARQKPSIAAFGDSNCVGYREGPAGTKRYLDKCLRRSFHLVAPALGRTRLTILQSRTQFLPWSRARAGDASACEADYALVVLGTNDITQLQGRAMEWSEGQSNKQIARRLRGELRAALRWVRGRTRRKIFVVEPVNEMRRKVAHRQLVADAMKAEVASLGGVTWIPMAWSDADLQRRRSERGMQLDPRHFNRAAARRIVESVEHAMPRGDWPPQGHRNPQWRRGHWLCGDYLPSLLQLSSLARAGRSLVQLRRYSAVPAKTAAYLQAQAAKLGSHYLSVEEANSEADHNAYCTSELAMSTKTRETRGGRTTY